MIRPATCPICKKPVMPAADGSEPAFRPFCSERCRQVDLIRWFDGKYFVVDPLTPEALEEANLPDLDAGE